MPTYDRTADFLSDWKHLTSEQRVQFKAAVHDFVIDLKSKQGVRASLGVKRFHSIPGVWEFTWAADGRALFRYGTSPHPDDTHIIWLRVGTHKIYRDR